MISQIELKTNKHGGTYLAANGHRPVVIWSQECNAYYKRYAHLLTSDPQEAAVMSLAKAYGKTRTANLQDGIHYAFIDELK